MIELLARDERASIATSLSANAFLRRSTRRRGRRSGHREWLHFCVLDDDLELIINLSVVDDPRVERGERVRVLVLARQSQAWRGDLVEIPPEAIDLRGGQLHVRAGDHTIEMVADAIVLRGTSRDGAIAFDLRLAPQVFPWVARDVAIGGEAPINWLLVPRLRADGTVTIDGVHRELSAALAYHDHNWGFFTHRDFAWQWGHAHDGQAHTVVVSRLLDRAQSTCHQQSLALWRGARLERIFRDGDLTIRSDGFLRPERTLTLPRLASLLADGATEVPRTLAIEAVSGDDALRGTFTAHDLARVVVPEDDDLRTTVIHEVVGRLVLRGVVGGAPVDLDARAIFELLRSVP